MDLHLFFRILRTVATRRRIVAESCALGRCAIRLQFGRHGAQVFERTFRRIPAIRIVYRALHGCAVLGLDRLAAVQLIEIRARDDQA